MSTSTLPRLQLRTAMEARDLDAAVEAFAPDAVLRSPLTGRLVFRGRDQIRTVTGIVLEAFEDLRYTGEVNDGSTAFLLSRAHIEGQEIEIADHVVLDEDGRISELTVFCRPLPAAAVALRVLGTALARRRGAKRAAVISALTRPLAFLINRGDGIGVRIVRPSAP
jgi:hypothetical protein